ncbi:MULTISPECIES: DeoR family transcriptional regulator [Savagea]|uniref:DeoR family transcriptional regulator n=2 Tax=Savagea TaxID=1655429 RepID=A0A8J7GJ87_9BACL|nr:DeoR family transcriptional regulator [Savagea serpentis]MBF4499793.1 DeoR family transcriptional regulator [Savagea serpentis]
MSNSTDRMLRRVKDVYFFILDNGVVTTDRIVEEFGVTARTVQRDLNVLEYNELIKSPTRGQWTTTEIEVELSS